MSENHVETVVRQDAGLAIDQDELRVKRPARAPEREPDSSSDAIKPLPMEFKPRKRPGRTDGITPRFESMLEEASRAGYENGYRAAFQALGLDARAVRVMRILTVRDALKVLPGLDQNDRIAVLKRLEEMPPGDD